MNLKYVMIIPEKLLAIFYGLSAILILNNIKIKLNFLKSHKNFEQFL